MIGLNKEVKDTMDKALLNLTKLQVFDGSWRFCFEGPPLTDAYMILLLRLFESREEGLIQSIANRLPDGSSKSREIHAGTH